MTSNQYFQIDENAERHHICATLNGFWNVKVLERFDREARRAVSDLAHRSAGLGLTVLIDARNSVAQSQEVAAGLQALSEGLGKDIRKTAVLVTSKVHKMQAQRINPASYHQIFHAMEEALAWLAIDEPNPV